jgi:hypothetical protein
MLLESIVIRPVEVAAVSCHWISDGVNSRYALESSRSPSVNFNNLKDRYLVLQLFLENPSLVFTLTPIFVVNHWYRPSVN